MSRFAFKEWAVVCAALAEGRQSVILRKGGIAEGPSGFRVEHREFWLFPTQFHQNSDDLVPDARGLVPAATDMEPKSGTIRLSLFATVQDVIHLQLESQLHLLAGLTVLSDSTIEKRFHYRSDGLFVLPVRVSRLAQPIVLPDSPHFAGCRSWVELPGALPTEQLTPVLSDEAAAERFQTIRARMPRIEWA